MGKPAEDYDRLRREAGEVVNGPHDGHKAKVERYGEARTKALSIRQYVHNHCTEYSQNDKHLLMRQLPKLKACGHRLIFDYAYSRDEYRLTFGNFCNNKWLDPLCGIRWSEKAVSEYVKRHEVVTAQYPEAKRIFMTLTVKNGKCLAKAYNKLDSSLKKMSANIRKARQGKNSSEFGKILGMVGGIEIKRSVRPPYHWHPHFHAMILASDYLDHSRLRDEWHRMTGDSYIVDLREAAGDTHTFCEILSYSLKVSTMSPKDVVKAYLLLRGKSMLRSWGCYRGVKIPNELTDEPWENLEFARLVYRYMFRAESYSLEQYQQFDAEGNLIREVHTGIKPNSGGYDT